MSSTTTAVSGLTIGQVLRQTALQHPENDALVFSQSNLRLNYAQFDRRVDDVAKGLLAIGLTRGDHLAVWSTNHPEWVLLQFATARIGVVLVTVNPAYRESELAYVLQQSDAKAIALVPQFKASNYFDILEAVCPEISKSDAGETFRETLPKLRWVISVTDDVRDGMLSWSNLIAKATQVTDEQLTEAEEQLSCSDGINIQYTSGTTGRPKGAFLTHQNILLNGWYSGQMQRLTSEDRICIPVPMYHCFGCVLGTLSAVSYGAAMVFPHEYYDPGKTLDAISAERCTAIYGVPTMFVAELEHENYPKTDCSSLRTGIMAGSPCPIELMKRVTKEMGAREITIAYGQTEASPVITQTYAEDPIDLRVSTVGRTLPGVEVKIVDPETNEELGDEQSGELCARGHLVMLGYYNNPEATAKAVDADGWLHTGDLALRQKNSYYKITGRLKDMIIRGGENISPREIEEYLYQHEKVEQAQVVGVPDPKFGEEILACVKLRGGQTMSEEEIREFCKGSLAHYKVPRYVLFVEDYPLTVTGKIQKFKLRDQAIEILGLQKTTGTETA